MSFLRKLFGLDTNNELPTDVPKNLKALKRQVAHLANKKYPFLDADYSPSSRVPCSDFTSFICARLNARDTRTVQALMREIIEANPGMGIGPGWIDKAVDKAIGFPIEKYVSMDDQQGYCEFRAISILFSKSGSSDRYFWVTGSWPQFLAIVLSPYRPIWTGDLESTVDRANRKIRKLRREELPFWMEYPLFDKQLDQPIAPSCNNILAKLMGLPPSARLMFHNFARRGSGELSRCSTYDMRSLGMDSAGCASSLLSIGLASRSPSPESVASRLKKDELLKVADRHGVEVKKSWTKKRIADIMSKEQPEALIKIGTKLGVSVIPTELERETQSWLEYVDSLTIGFALSCFAKP